MAVCKYKCVPGAVAVHYDRRHQPEWFFVTSFRGHSPVSLCNPRWQDEVQRYVRELEITHLFVCNRGTFRDLAFREWGEVVLRPVVVHGTCPNCLEKDCVVHDAWTALTQSLTRLQDEFLHSRG